MLMLFHFMQTCISESESCGAVNFETTTSDNFESVYQKLPENILCADRIFYTQLYAETAIPKLLTHWETKTKESKVDGNTDSNRHGQLRHVAYTMQVPSTTLHQQCSSLAVATSSVWFLSVYDKIYLLLINFFLNCFVTSVLLIVWLSLVAHFQIYCNKMP